MTLWIYVLSGKELGRAESFDRMTVVVGRGEEADLRLSETTVSRKHARLRWHATGAIEFEDLNSTSGTYLLGERVQRGWLSDGDSIRLGEVELRVRVQMGGQRDAEVREVDLPIEEEQASGGDVELEGVWEEPTVRPRTPAPRATSPPQAQAPSTGAKTKAPTIAPKARPKPVQGPKGALKTTAGSRILQYSENADAETHGGGDLAQRPGWMRGLAILLAFLCMAALAYGAFRLTQGVKGSRQAPSDLPEEVTQE